MELLIIAKYFVGSCWQLLYVIFRSADTFYCVQNLQLYSDVFPQARILLDGVESSDTRESDDEDKVYIIIRVVFSPTSVCNHMTGSLTDMEAGSLNFYMNICWKN